MLCYAKSLQLCPTLCDPRDSTPPGSPVPEILQARTPEWVATSFSNAWKWKVKVKSLSRVRLLATPWTAAYQAPLSMGFSRQEYWSGVPLPSPEARNTWFVKPAELEDDRLLSENSHFIGVSFFYRTEKGRRWRSKVKRPFILQNISSLGQHQGRGCVNFFFSAVTHRWAGSDHLPSSWSKAL